MARAHAHARAKQAKEAVDGKGDHPQSDQHEGSEEEAEKPFLKTAVSGAPRPNDLHEEDGNDAVPKDGNEDTADELGHGRRFGFENDVVLNGSLRRKRDLFALCESGTFARDANDTADANEDENQGNEAKPYFRRETTLENSVAGILGIDVADFRRTGRVLIDDLLFPPSTAGRATEEMIAMRAVLASIDLVAINNVDTVGRAAPAPPVALNTAGDDSAGNCVPVAGLHYPDRRADEDKIEDRQAD